MISYGMTRRQISAMPRLTLYQEYINKSVTPFPCVKAKTSTLRNWTTTTATYINIPFKRLSRLSAFHPCIHYTFLFENSRYFNSPNPYFSETFFLMAMLGTDSQKTGIFMPNWKQASTRAFTVLITFLYEEEKPLVFSLKRSCGFTRLGLFNRDSACLDSRLWLVIFERFFRIILVFVPDTRHCRIVRMNDMDLDSHVGIRAYQCLRVFLHPVVDVDFQTSGRTCKKFTFVALVVEWSKAHVFVRTATRISGVRALVPARTRKWLGVSKKGVSFQGFFWLQVCDIMMSPEQGHIWILGLRPENWGLRCGFPRTWFSLQGLNPLKGLVKPIRINSQPDVRRKTVEF